MRLKPGAGYFLAGLACIEAAVGIFIGLTLGSRLSPLEIFVVGGCAGALVAAVATGICGIQWEQES